MAYDFRTKFKYISRRRSIMGRALLNCAKIAFGGKPLRYVCLATNWDCNIKCVHCYATHYREEGRRVLNINDWEKIVDDCVKLGTLSFDLQGGEPLILPCTEQLISIIKSRNAFPVVTTNGLLLSEKAESLKKAGLESLIISLNGLGETHDEFCNQPGLFNALLEGIDKAQELGIHVSALTVATNKSLETGETRRMADFLHARGVDLWMLYPAPVGRWQGTEDAFLTDENLVLFDSLSELDYVQPEGSANYFKSGCGAGIETIYISPYGDVTPCPFVKISFGNALETPIREIIQKMRKIDYFHDIQPRCIASCDRDFQAAFMKPVENAKGAVPIEALDGYPSDVALEERDGAGSPDASSTAHPSRF